MHNPDGSFLTKLVWWVVIGGLAYAGWWGYKRIFVGHQHATMERVLVNSDGNMARVEIAFEEYPKAGDLRDVQLKLWSKALARTVTLNWTQIAEQDNSEQTTASERPPLGARVRLRVPIELRTSLIGGTGDVMLHAELYWAGQKQDEATGTLWDRYSSR